MSVRTCGVREWNCQASERWQLFFVDGLGLGLPCIEQSANIVYNEAPHLLVNCTLLTNDRTVLPFRDHTIVATRSRVAQGAYLEFEYIRNVLSVSDTLRYADSGTE